MSLCILNEPEVRSRNDGVARRTFYGAGPDTTYGSNGLGLWQLQRMPHQRGRWYMQLHVRGLCICCYAVQDDFGNLQVVEA